VRVGLQQLRRSPGCSRGENSTSITAHRNGGEDLRRPIDAGLSCLAALPSTVKHLVPEPYRWLSDDTVEQVYASCMDSYDNWFDMRKFERLCNIRVKEELSGDIQTSNPDKANGTSNGADSGFESSPSHVERHQHGRRIFTSDHSWNLLSRVWKPLSHPFDPPVPFTDRMSPLEQDSWIRASKVMAVQETRPRPVWGEHATESTYQHQIKSPGTKNGAVGKKGFVRKSADDLVRDVDDGSTALLSGVTCIEDVPYTVAYPKLKRVNRGKRSTADSHQRAETIKPALEDESATHSSNPQDTCPEPKYDGDSPPLLVWDRDSTTTADGISAVACLKQLEDAGLIGAIGWEISLVQLPHSATDYYERVRLTIASGGRGSDAGAVLQFEMDRNVNAVSRQAVRQNLASLAIQAIVVSAEDEVGGSRGATETAPDGDSADPNRATGSGDGNSNSWSQRTFKSLRQLIASKRKEEEEM